MSGVRFACLISMAIGTLGILIAIVSRSDGDIARGQIGAILFSGGLVGECILSLGRRNGPPAE